MNLKSTASSEWGLEKFIFFLIYILGPLLTLQFFISTPFITSPLMKFGILLLSFYVLLRKKDGIKKEAPFLLLFFSFFLMNTFSFLTETSKFSSSISTLLAFFYNYSLNFTLIPLAYILKKNSIYKPPSFKRSTRGLFFIVLIFNLFGILQFISNDYLLPSYVIESISSSGGAIRLDHINGIIRAMSFFKKPFEFGIFNVLFAILSLHLFIELRKKSILILFAICSLSTAVTVSRTAILMLLVSTFLSLIILYKKRKEECRHFVKKGAFFLIPAPVLFMVFATNFPHLIDTFLTPTNLENRLYDWLNALDLFFSNGGNFWHGLGIVQNGKYGDYHKVPIDNTFVGLILTGGILPLLLFLLFNYFYLVRTPEDETLSGFKDIEKIFVAAFFSAAFFENMMHMWYFITLPIFLLIGIGCLQRNETTTHLPK